MKRCFVTGAYGFIGTHLCKRLTELGHVAYEGNYNEFPIGGLFDCVVHLAGKTTLSKDFNPDLIESNIIYSHKLFETFPGKIIYASSTSAAELTNPYAYSKRYLEYLGSKHGNAVGLRFFNVYGNGCNRGIIKAAIDCARSGDTLPLYGGDNTRDFIYIDDVVNHIIASLDKRPGVYDVGTGVGISVREAVRKVSEVIGSAIYTRTFDPSDTDMLVSVASPGIPGCLSLEQGLRRMLECEY